MGLERKVIDPTAAVDPLVITGVSKCSLLSNSSSNGVFLICTHADSGGFPPVSLEGQLGASQPREETCPSSCPTNHLIEWPLQA